MLANILLGIVTLCTFFSYLPQVVKIIKNKVASDLSITSWVLWVLSSLAYLLYAFICSNEFMLKVETSVEFLFCLFILILTIKYRKTSIFRRIKLLINKLF